MTRTEKKRVKAAIAADRTIVDCRIQLRQLAEMCFEAGDREAAVLVQAAVDVLQRVAIYAVKTQRVEVDESK